MKSWWRRRDSKLLQCNSLHSPETQQNSNTSSTIPCIPRYWEGRDTPWQRLSSIETTQFSDSSEQKKCAVYVPTPEVPLDLQLVFNAWENLPKETRTKIVRLVLEALE